ncbi:hypothetical protein SNEBB_000379 [Seison nebaliae]|nr:hypothetical protein SNEBB_000379 [Seison nebaliae]
MTNFHLKDWISRCLIPNVEDDSMVLLDGWRGFNAATEIIDELSNIFIKGRVVIRFNDGMIFIMKRCR